MPRDYRVYLDDICGAAEKILRYAADPDYEALLADERSLDAIARNLEVIGEAAKHLPEAVWARCPDVSGARLPASGIS